jgi:hypothetical protein
MNLIISKVAHHSEGISGWPFALSSKSMTALRPFTEVDHPRPESSRSLYRRTDLVVSTVYETMLSEPGLQSPVGSHSVNPVRRYFVHGVMGTGGRTTRQ